MFEVSSNFDNKSNISELNDLNKSERIHSGSSTDSYERNKRGKDSLMHILIRIFSFKSNIDYLYKSNSLIKYGQACDIEWTNFFRTIFGIWGIMISTPYYFLSTPVYNFWRFLSLFGLPPVAVIFSGYSSPQIIILMSCFLGFVRFAQKFEECNQNVRIFMKTSLLIICSKYIKFLILTIIATWYTVWISPFLIDSPNYYVSEISYDTWYKDWWWNFLMVGNFSHTEQYGMKGCIPWIWILSWIFQFWCLIPFITILYYRLLQNLPFVFNKINRI